ncbi:O-antigen ligase family protein [Mycolicibacterium tusciae]|uniref:O-antigen ligase family protein n=1 Tax=Mycolicibacterium tusciae TaxID=75922 RepID=UPI001EF84F4B|nr:O-antigen ligase family protein [Mycolicibacterium tusciae]
MVVALVKSHPSIGIVLVGLSVIPLWEASRPPPLVTLAGLSIFPADVITFSLLVVGVLEFAQLQANLRGWLVPWLLFGALIAFSLLRGVVAFGLGTAINEAREIVWFFFAMTWALSIHPSRLKLHTASLVLGWALVVVGLYHGVVYGIGDASSWVFLDDGTRKAGRLLVSQQALILVCCAGVVFLGSSRSGKSRPRFVASSLVFLGVVVLAQIRSVWIAASVGIVAVLIWSGQKRVRNRVFVMLVAGGSLVLIGWFSGMLKSIGSELIASASNTDTLDWRTSGWQTLISRAIANGPVAVAGGEPFGSGYVRRVEGGAWTVVAPHSWYVEIFLRLGIIGLTVLAATLIPAVAKSRASRSMWTFLLVVVGISGWADTVDWYVAPWLGAAMVASLGAGRAAQGVITSASSVNLDAARSARERIGASGSNSSPSPSEVGLR